MENTEAVTTTAKDLLKKNPFILKSKSCESTTKIPIINCIEANVRAFILLKSAIPNTTNTSKTTSI